MSGTAAALLSHAVQLSELVNRFRLQSDTTPPARRTTQRPATRGTTPAAETPKTKKPLAVVMNDNFAMNTTESGVMEF